MCAAVTDDLRAVIRVHLSPSALRFRYHGSTVAASSACPAGVPPVFVIGFSMGGNIVSKMLAEDGAAMIAAEAAGDGEVPSALHLTCHQYIKAGIAVSCPWDFFSATYTLSRGINHYLYDSSLVGGVCDYVRDNTGVFTADDHDDKSGDAAKSPLRPAPCLAFATAPPNVEAPKVAESLREVDDFIVAPHYAYAGAEYYHRDAEAFRRLHTLRTPLLAVSATEDPIVGPARPDAHWEQTVNGIKWPFGTAPAEELRPTTWAEHDALLQKRAAAMQPAPVEQRPPIAYMRVPTGGHLGFLGTPLQEWRGEPNTSERIILRALANAVA
jgi:predicted alpha/beta-fold hydrolase